jgi:hypothetical protein
MQDQLYMLELAGQKKARHPRAGSRKQALRVR